VLWNTTLAEPVGTANFVAPKIEVPVASCTSTATPLAPLGATAKLKAHSVKVPAAIVAM
jgi:hypothetical protein